MAPYIGDRIPLRVEEVQVGHRLVDQEAAGGWLEVVGVEQRADDEIVLHFDNGEQETYWAGDPLFRVAS